MIDMTALIERFSDLDHQDLDRWILNAWVHPDGPPGHYAFREIDVARIRLIIELRDQMQVNEDALPVVLLLLDQLHDVRRRMREVGEVLERVAPEPMRLEMLRQLQAPRPSVGSPGRRPPSSPRG